MSVEFQVVLRQTCEAWQTKWRGCLWFIEYNQVNRMQPAALVLMVREVGDNFYKIRVLSPDRQEVIDPTESKIRYSSLGEVILQQSQRGGRVLTQK